MLLGLIVYPFRCLALLQWYRGRLFSVSPIKAKQAQQAGLYGAKTLSKLLDDLQPIAAIVIISSGLISWVTSLSENSPPTPWVAVAGHFPPA